MVLCGGSRCGAVQRAQRSVVRCSAAVQYDDIEKACRTHLCCVTYSDPATASHKNNFNVNYVS